LRVEIQDRVAAVILNRPAQHNAITSAMWAAIPALCDRLAANDRVRMIIWRGAGNLAFSAGGDISEFVQLRNNRVQAAEYNARVDAALNAIATLPKPTLAAIHGYCMGGGLMLSCACDLRLANSIARFAVPVARLGATVTLPQMKRFLDLLGPGATSELLLTGGVWSAQDAVRLGLCSHVFDSSEFDSNLQRVVDQVLHGAPLSATIHKRMIRLLQQAGGLDALAQDEFARVDAIFDSLDYAEGARAFLEKREPRFRGE
jgi:enoyl-CoA hydratase/carnithine racemase